jgi:sec-independent protein translocase protein TatA
MLANGFTGWHLLIVVAVLILLFGAKRLPDAARSLGKSMRIFKSEVKEMQSDSNQEPAASAPTPIASERVEPTPPAPAPKQSADKHPA